jgi:hypothetical protein
MAYVFVLDVCWNLGGAEHADGQRLRLTRRHGTPIDPAANTFPTALLEPIAVDGPSDLVLFLVSTTARCGDVSSASIAQFRQRRPMVSNLI